MVEADENSPGETASRSQSRRRKWHPRVFSGCVQCRRRHIKCDEKAPSCSSCVRRSISCDYTQRSMFKVLNPHTYRHPNAQTTAAADHIIPAPEDGFSLLPQPDETSLIAFDAAPETPGLVDFGHDDFLGFTPNDMSSAEMNNHDNESASGGSPSTYSVVISSPSAELASPDMQYYSHFLTTVSTLLIIYDTDSNSNPYRILPQLAGDSGLLRDTMVALGAMSLSNLTNTQDKQLHKRAAMETYAGVVTRLRGIVSANETTSSRLELLASSLLMCMFEKMSSDDGNWKIHLSGAREILEEMYSPRIATSTYGTRGNDLDHATTSPIRRFLISLMSYLDVAAACATGEGTLIPGDYWETFGGGWEYNLGVPSLRPASSPADRILTQIRQSWSRIMSIQADISMLEKLQKGGLNPRRRDVLRNDLADRLRNWRIAAPDIYLRLSKLSRIPPDASARDVEVLTAAACVECYERACEVYLDRVATQSLINAAFDQDISAAVDRILELSLNFSSGLERMAILWPIFTAGVATVRPDQQAKLRHYLTDLTGFGFKHVSRALDIMEYVWLQHRLFGEANYSEFRNLASTNLLP